MKLWTTALSQWRFVQAKGIPLFDITLKSGDPYFSPTASLLYAYKRGEIDSTTYTQEFTRLMRERWVENRNQWLVVLDQPEVAIACFCRAGGFCHRHLVVDFAMKAAPHFGIDLQYQGELRKET